MSLTILQFLVRFCKRNREHLTVKNSYFSTCPVILLSINATSKHAQDVVSSKGAFRRTCWTRPRSSKACHNLPVYCIKQNPASGSEPLKCMDMSQQIKANLLPKANVFILVATKHVNINLINFTYSLRSPPPYLCTTN